MYTSENSGVLNGWRESQSNRYRTVGISCSNGLFARAAYSDALKASRKIRQFIDVLTLHMAIGFFEP